jgi:hypothetical protein
MSARRATVRGGGEEAEGEGAVSITPITPVPAATLKGMPRAVSSRCMRAEVLCSSRESSGYL